MTAITYRSTDVNGLKALLPRVRPLRRPEAAVAPRLPKRQPHVPGPDPQLTDRFHVVAPDLLGFGQSDMPSRDSFTYTFQALTEVLARVSENRAKSGLFSLVSYGSWGGFGVLPMSASGGVAGEAEDGGEFVLDGAGFGEHAVGSGPAAVAVVEQDGLADAGELAQQFADRHP